MDNLKFCLRQGTHFILPDIRANTDPKPQESDRNSEIRPNHAGGCGRGAGNGDYTPLRRDRAIIMLARPSGPSPRRHCGPVGFPIAACTMDA